MSGACTLKKNCLKFMHMRVLPACRYLHYVYAWCQGRSKVGFQSPETGIIGGYEPPCGCWERSLGLLKSSKCSYLLGQLSSPLILVWLVHCPILSVLKSVVCVLVCFWLFMVTCQIYSHSVLARGASAVHSCDGSGVWEQPDMLWFFGQQ